MKVGVFVQLQIQQQSIYSFLYFFNLINIPQKKGILPDSNQRTPLALNRRTFVNCQEPVSAGHPQKLER